MMIIRTIIEIAVVVLVIYGFTKEDKFIAFEDRIAERIRNRKR